MKRVSLIAAFRDGLLLLGRRNDNGKWTVAGGTLEDGESPEEGARRELLEETGLTPDGELTLVDERTLGETTLYTFECTVSDGVPDGSNDPDKECALWCFFDVSDGIPKAVAEHMAGPKDPEKNVTADLYGLAKAEEDAVELEKMAIADIRRGKEVGTTVNPMLGEMKEYDYDHTLTPEHRTLGYGIRVYHQKEADNDHFFEAALTHNNTQVGSVRASTYNAPHGAIEPHSEIKPEHRGKGLGTALYEALYRHAQLNGVKRVSGEYHSSDAARVHQKLATKHGLEYHANPGDPRDFQGRGSFDGYDYAIKSEPGLAKMSTERIANLEVNDPAPNPHFNPGPNMHVSATEPDKRIKNLEVGDQPPPATPLSATSLPTKPTDHHLRDVGQLKHYDYSHLLPERHRAAGAKLIGDSLPLPLHPEHVRHSMAVYLPGRTVPVFVKGAYPTSAGHALSWASPQQPADADLDQAIHGALQHHLDLHGSGKLATIPGNLPGVRRVNNQYADKKTTESTAGLFSSNRKMSERKAFDYSHVLPEERRNQGYGLTIYHHPSAPAIAELTQNGKRSASLTYHGHDWQRRQEPGASPPSWGQFGHMQEALGEHDQNATKMVQHVSDTSVGSTPFLDTLPLPEGPPRASLLEVDKKRAKRPVDSKAADEKTGDRASSLDVQDMPVDDMPMPSVVGPGHPQHDYSKSPRWDYSHHLTPEQRAAGWSLEARHTLGGDNYMQMHAYKDSGYGDRVSRGNLWAYPSQPGGLSGIERAGIWNNAGGVEARPLESQMRAAMTQHQKLFHQGELQRMLQPNPSRASLLELSEKDFMGVTKFIVNLLKEEQQPGVKRLRKPKAPAPAPEPDLVGTHNLTHENLAHAHELGGLVAPSLSIGKKDHPLENFGEVSLVAGHHLIDPAQVPVFDADVYSPRHPRAWNNVHPKKFREFKQDLEPHSKRTGSYMGNMDEELMQRGPEYMLENRTHRAALGLAYLKEKGVDVKDPMQATRINYPWAGHPAMKEYLASHGKSDHEKSPVAMTELSDAVRNSISQWADKQGPDLEYNKDLKRVAHEDIFGNEEGVGDIMANPNRLARILEDGDRAGQREPNKHRLVDDVHAELRKHPDFDKWAADKVGGVLDGRFLPKHIDTANGPSLRRIPYTPENVLKQMTRTVRGGEGSMGSMGLGHVRSMGATRFKDVAHMQANRHRIVSENQMKRAKDANDTKYENLAAEVQKYHYDRDGWQASTGLETALGESFGRGKGLHQALKDNGFTGVPPELVQKLHEFRENLVKMPTEYFEAKPQRVVGLNEFHGAVIPNDSPQSTLDILRHHGINHVERYDPNGDGERTAAIQRIHAAKNLFLGEMPMNKAEDDEIDRMLLHPDPTERSMALKLQGVRPKHLVRALADSDENIQRAALHHPALDQNALTALFKMPDRPRMQLLALHHADVHAEHLASLYDLHRGRAPQDRAPIMRAIGHHVALDGGLITRMLQDGNGYEAVDNLNAPPEALHQLVRNRMDEPNNPKHRALARRALVHPNLPPGTAADAFKNGDLDVKMAVAGGPHLPEAEAHDVLAGGQFPAHDHEALLRMTILQNPKATDKHRAQATRDRNAAVRQAAANPMVKNATTWVAEQLKKAIHGPDYADIRNASDTAGRDLVDHKPDLGAHPPEHNLDATVYRQQVLDHPKTVKQDPQKIEEGITKKLVYTVPGTHATHAGARFMVKPYHEAVLPHLSRFGKNPTLGWAEMTNQALYHAGGIGHLHQRVHVAEHNMDRVDQSGPDTNKLAADLSEVKPSTKPSPSSADFSKEPALVVRMEPNYVNADEMPYDHKHTPRARMDARKIGMMDFLSNNLDRHEHNLMVKQEHPNGPTSVLAIDHGRSFQYHRHAGYDHAIAPKKLTDSYHQYINDTAINRIDPYQGGKFSEKPLFDRQRQMLKDYGPVFEWWGENSKNIRSTFDKRLEQIRDPEVRAHIKRNFDARANWLDERHNYGLENYGESWYKDPVDMHRTDKAQAAVDHDHRHDEAGYQEDPSGSWRDH